MDKASKITLDKTVKKMIDSELGFILLEADEKSIYDVLAEKTTWKDRAGMYGNGYHITYHLFPVLYSGKDMDIKSNLAESRMNAVQNIFMRWTEAGYNKRHAKKPFECKAFMKYLDEIEFMKADYMLLMVD